MDKLTDRKGNLEWLTGHFSSTAIQHWVPFLLLTITILELSTGVLCIAGIVSLVIGGPHWLPILALTLSGTTLAMLFSGQRIAKDYVGAAVLASYFAVALIGLWSMTGM